MIKKLQRILTDPAEFFNSIRGEGFREPLGFLLCITVVIAIITPAANFLGWPSTDTSSAFQSQILAWRLTDQYLLPRIGFWAYFVESLLIIGFTLLLASVLSVLIHLMFRVARGKGPLLNGWKVVCYGVGPCILFGWVPYWSLFVGTWSLILQVYYGPKILYGLPEGRALWILVFFVGATLLEFALMGTTVGFGPR